MREHMELGPTPAMEECADIRTPDYRERAMREGRAFIGVIRRAFPDLPDGLTLRVKSFPHDFGSYFEVCACFDDQDETAAEAAYMLESNTPESWDEEARAELGLSPAIV
jgi:hypothetical protein